MHQATYLEFLAKKIKVAPNRGFDWLNYHPSSKPHQQDVTSWAINKGCCLIGMSFGLGKTQIQFELARAVKETKGGNSLQVLPLGARQEFTQKDAKRLGVKCRYVRNTDEWLAAIKDNCYTVTNYERVRDGSFDIRLMQEHFLMCVLLDEGDVLRNLGSDTTQAFIEMFRTVEYKFVSTATPSPNEYLELINYADFLGVMDRGQALTRFFQRDSNKAGNLTLHPHHERDFWLWVSSWAIFLTKPSDLGYSDEGYALPPLTVNYHMVKVPMERFGTTADRDGQVKMLPDSAESLQESAKIKRLSIPERIAKMSEILALSADEHHIIWHNLEDERKAIEKAVVGVVSIHGNQDLDKREKMIIDFADGHIKNLAPKPEITGAGCNFQHHCNRNVYLGVNYKFKDFIQSIHRTYRFMQTKEVFADIIYVEQEQAIIDSLKEKWARHDELQARMSEIIQTYGLNHEQHIAELKRSFGCDRQEAKGKMYTFVNNDSVLELPRLETNSVGLIHTSIPFGNHYEYSASYNDFGHNEDNGVFWEQMDYLIPELYRALKPGHRAVIHVKDRIQYGTMTGLGTYSLLPFSDETTTAMRKHGFIFDGRITIQTDVVRENNQTYRLGWTEKCKDATKHSVGLPEYLLLFRKPQTDRSKGYADEPVVKNKEEYDRGKWQIHANSFWKSSGNRLATPEDLATWNHDKIVKWFKQWNIHEVYDYQFHITLAQELEAKKKLPSTYGLLQPHTNNDWVWTEVSYMHGLNAEQNRNKAEKHICPLPFDIVERVIDTYSNPGDLVIDPFGGLGTVPYMAVKMGRRGWGCELNADYWKCGCGYLKAVEYEQTVPTLFDTFKEAV